MRRPWRGAIAAGLAAAVAACGGAGGTGTSAATGAPAGDPIACDGVVELPGTGSKLSGQRDAAGICRYLGLPFAGDTGGENRFRPPADPPAWGGVRAATAFGEPCLQEIGALDLGQTPSFGSEDCLFLNVWRPASQAEEPYPVMVFIHGGAFTLGAGSWPQYEGTYLAMHGVVVVALNYRLGPFGFLALPELEAEAQTDSALTGSYGNYGLLDQVAGLQWVRDNIAAFGGDPGNVTVFGESAGAMSVCSLMASPLANGQGEGPALFHKAIMESGGCTAVGLERKSFTQGTTFAVQAGCGGAADRLACLRGLGGEELMERVTVDAIADGYQPHVDGVVLEQVPMTAVQTGAVAKVPLLAGSNRDEVRPTVIHPPTLDYIDASWERFHQRLAAIYGAGPASRLAALYPPADFPTPVRAWAAIQSDYMLNCPTQLAAAAHRKNANTYHYTFRWDDMPLGEYFGAFHAWELPFVFGTLEAWNPLYGTRLREVKAMSAAVQRYWTRFAKSGDPNRGADGAANAGTRVMPWDTGEAALADLRWPPYDGGASMVLDAPLSTEMNLRQERCAFWESRIPVGLDELTEDVVALAE